MKKNRFRWKFLIFFLVFLPISCGRFAEPQSQGGGPRLNFNPGDGGPNGSSTPFAIVDIVLNLLPTNFIPNRIVVSGQFAYIVNSGSNNIQRIHLQSGFQEDQFIILPPGSSPFAMAIAGNRGFVTNFITNTVSVVDVINGGGEIGAIFPNANGNIIKPQDIAVAANGLIFVANTNIDFSTGQTVYGPGFVSVIDPTTLQIINTIFTTQKNPQFILARGNTVFITNSGEVQFDLGCFCFRPLNDGGIDIIDATQAENANGPQDNIALVLSPNLPLNGYPGRLAITADGNFGYLGSNSGVLFKVDILNRSVLRGTGNPIVVTPNARDNLLTMNIDSAGVFWLLSFNEDRVYFFNPATDEVDANFASLDSDPPTLEGPLDIAFSNNGVFPDAYIIMSISEEVSAILTN